MNKKRKRTKWLRLLVPFIAVIGFNGLVFAGSLDPDGSPAPTMRTLDEITPVWNKKLPASERFVDALDGNAVLDRETGLVWEKSPDTNKKKWTDAIASCYTKKVDGQKGWRLPSIDQLTSLVDDIQSDPALPAGHPFENLQDFFYWSDTQFDIDNFVWVVEFGSGSVSALINSFNSHALCVRSGS